MGTRCNTAAAPATVTGERSSDMPLRQVPWEGGRERLSREPGDLPRAVVLFPTGVRRGLRGKPSRRHVGVVVAGPRFSHANCKTPFAFAGRLLVSTQENVMRKSFPFSTAALIVLGATTAALADDSTETVVVTATRIPTPESHIASSMTVITADDIAAKGLDTLPDVLADAPGLNIVQEGGPGGQTSVFMRGVNSNHVKVLVDGIDVSDVSNP